MNLLVIKILAVGMTLSQLFTKPVEQFKTQFNASADREEIEKILHEGCTFMTKEFGAEQIDFEFLFNMMTSNIKAAQEKAAANSTPSSTAAPGSPPATSTPAKKLSKLTELMDIPTIFAAYKQFCKGEKVENSPVQMDAVIEFYNKAFTDLPDPNKLKDLHLPESALVLDGNGERFSEIYEDNNRRRWVSIDQIPDFVQKAFIAAEDKRFREHPGVDIRGIIRAFASTLSSKGRPQGGSTITQQVVKNLLVGDDLSFERKMREMYLALRVEKILSKKQILELYLNFVFLGRASWGVEMAAQSYFGKKISDVTVSEGSVLAALTRGPNYYNPEIHPDRLQDRREYVLSRMKEDGYLTDNGLTMALQNNIELVKFETPKARAGYYFLDEVLRDVREKTKIKNVTSGSYVIRSTIHRGLQKETDIALRDGLARYEELAGRVGDFEREGSLSEEIEKWGISWQELLPRRRGKLFDIHWTLATVVDNGQRIGTRPASGVIKVGLPDGRVAVVNNSTARIARALKIYDLVRVKVTEGKTLVASLRVPPQVQGAVVVLEAKTGRVLAMSGGFSYAASQLNRATRTIRQPGSTLKPFIYLTGLNLGLQPNTLVPDQPISLPPVGRGGQWWSPRNYDGEARGMVTMRRAVEMSLNLPTVRLMSQMGRTPLDGLDYIRELTKSLGIYSDPVRFYPFVLGAQATRLIDMAVAYATVANIGLKPTPHFFDSIQESGQEVPLPSYELQKVPNVDRVSFYQLRRILEGTVARGTAAQIKDLSGYVGGKTGTSNGFNDAWFIGFTNDLVVATWVGYDSRGVKASLGSQFTGASVALPIAERILRESFKIYKDKELLSEAPDDVRPKIGVWAIDVFSGQFNAGTFPEVFRLDRPGVPRNTATALLRGNERLLTYEQPTEGETQMGEADDSAGMPQQPQMHAQIQPQYPQPYPQQRPYYDPNYVRGPRPLAPNGYPNAYRPGDEDMNDTWARRNRRVDPSFRFNPYETY